MTIETKQFNFFAIGTGITLLVYLGGSVYALVTKDIAFPAFLAAVGTPLGAMSGWAAKGASVPAALLK